MSVGLAVNVTIIKVSDRTPDGFYEIGGGQIQIHPFTVNVNGQLTIPAQQVPRRQTFSIRAWIDIIPMGSGLISRFHPGTGGIIHIFFDESLDPVPTVMDKPHRNAFSEISFIPREVLVPLPPGEYFYHFLNMEGALNVYKVGFTSAGAPENTDDPCAIFN